jgi:hypothetical protein
MTRSYEFKGFTRAHLVIAAPKEMSDHSDAST